MERPSIPQTATLHESRPTASGLVTYDPGSAPSYGTSSDRYKMWFDYLFDLAGASLDRPLRLCGVSVGVGVLIFAAGFLIATAFGHQALYLGTSAVYILCIAVAYTLG